MKFLQFYLPSYLILLCNVHIVRFLDVVTLSIVQKEDPNFSELVFVGEFNTSPKELTALLEGPLVLLCPNFTMYL